MPFWMCALTSGGLLALGLWGWLQRQGIPRTLAGLLMWQGAVLLLVAAGTRFRHAEGAAAALLILGLLPVELWVGSCSGKPCAPPGNADKLAE